MKQNINIGQTDYTALVFIPDPASTDGSGKTGLVAANLTASYTRVETDNDVVLVDATSSLNDLASLTSAHTDSGIKEVSSTLAPGLYRLDFADACFATGAWTCVVYLMITTSAAAASPMEFILVIAPGATGGLPVIGTGLNNFKSDGSANVTFANTSIATATAVTTVNGLAANVITATSIATGAITSAKFAAGAINSAAIADGSIDAATFAAGAIDATAIAAGAFTAAKFAANAIDAAALSSDAVDEIWAKAVSDLAGVPAANAQVIAALSFIFMALRNARNTTASADEVTNNAGTPIATATLSDNGTTFAKGEYA